MAALASVTKVGGRLPLGDLFLQIVRVGGATGIASATEWIDKADIGLETIVAAFAGVTGATGVTVNFLLNCATGTGGTANTSHGSLSVETSAALTNNLWAFVIGKP